MVDIQIRSHAYDGSPAAYRGGAAPAPPASAQRCPGGEMHGWGSGHLLASSPQGVAPNPQYYNPLPGTMRT